VLQGSFGAFVAMDMDEKFPRRSKVYPEKHVRGKQSKRRKRAYSESGDQSDLQSKEATCTVCLRYNGMLYMDFVASNEMVVVEQPWLSVVATFPDALQRRVYGS
jgi:U3 small nucleolar RNA-associated protein 4